MADGRIGLDRTFREEERGIFGKHLLAYRRGYIDNDFALPGGFVFDLPRGLPVHSRLVRSNLRSRSSTVGVVERDDQRGHIALRSGKPQRLQVGLCGRRFITSLQDDLIGNC